MSEGRTTLRSPPAARPPETERVCTHEAHGFADAAEGDCRRQDHHVRTVVRVDTERDKPRHTVGQKLFLEDGALNVPFQSNFDPDGRSSGNGRIWTTTLQPVIPVTFPFCFRIEPTEWDLRARTSR